MRKLFIHIKACNHYRKHYGITYALLSLFDIPGRFDDSNYKVLRDLSLYAREIYDKASWDAYVEEHLEELNEDENWRETIATPCGCIFFNDCRECSSYPVCSCC